MTHYNLEILQLSHVILILNMYFFHISVQSAKEPIVEPEKVKIKIKKKKIVRKKDNSNSSATEKSNLKIETSTTTSTSSVFGILRNTLSLFSNAQFGIILKYGLTFDFYLLNKLSEK